MDEMIIDEMLKYYSRRAAEYDASMGYDDPEVLALHDGEAVVFDTLTGKQQILGKSDP